MSIWAGLRVGVYAGLVLATQGFGFHSPVAVAAATLAAATLFNPVRQRVQQALEPAHVWVWASHSG
jgi:hypothetical protein